MTWETSRTWVVNELMTAAKFNSVRDNFSFLYSPPAARVYNDANISITSGTYVALTFNSEYYDNASMHDTSSNPSRLTAPIDGVYHITGSVSWGSGNGGRLIYIKQNDATRLAGQQQNGITTSQVSQGVDALAYLEEGDYVELEVIHNHGSAINIEAFGHSPVFQMAWMGGAA